MEETNKLEHDGLEVKGPKENNDEVIANMSADEFINKLAEFAGIDLTNELPQQENVAVTAEEDNAGEGQEKNMEELNTPAAELAGEAGCKAALEPEAATQTADLEAEAAKDKQNPEAKPEDKLNNEAPLPEGKKEEKPYEKCKECKDALDAVKELVKKHEGDEALVKELKDVTDILEGKGEKPAEKKEDKAPAQEAGDAKLDKELEKLLEEPAKGEDDKEPKAKDAKDEKLAPFANLVAVLTKKATVADSVWTIEDGNKNAFVSFNIKAAFGNDIDKDEVRSAYATSQEFGKAVIASLIENHVEDAITTKAAVLQVAAHYNPSYAGAKEYSENTESSFKKPTDAGDTETDKALVNGVKAEASATATLTKKASEEASATEDGKLASDATLVSGADKRPEAKENKKVDVSATPHATEQVEAETDIKLVASYKEELSKKASENEELRKQVESLKLEAAIKDKSAKVKECVSLMSSKGLVKADESVRIASLKEGLSVEAANGRAMAASLEKQAKYLFGMNSTQLDAYINSLKGMSAPVIRTSAATSSPLTIKASDSSLTEEDRLLHIFGWDK